MSSNIQICQQMSSNVLRWLEIFSNVFKNPNVFKDPNMSPNVETLVIPQLQIWDMRAIEPKTKINEVSSQLHVRLFLNIATFPAH